MVDLCFYCDGLSWENFWLLWFRKERVVVLEGSEFGMWAENYHNPIPSGVRLPPITFYPWGATLLPLPQTCKNHVGALRCGVIDKVVLEL